MEELVSEWAFSFLRIRPGTRRMETGKNLASSHKRQEQFFTVTLGTERIISYGLGGESQKMVTRGIGSV